MTPTLHEEAASLAELCDATAANFERDENDLMRTLLAPRAQKFRRAAALLRQISAPAAEAEEKCKLCDGTGWTGPWSQCICGAASKKVASAAEVPMPEPVAWRDPSNTHPGQSVTFLKDKAEKWPHIFRESLFTADQLRAYASARERAARADLPIVEVWHGDRKVTVHPGENVLQIQSPGSLVEFVSDQPHTLESVQEAMDWLYERAALQAQGWIAVSERLPEMFRNVAVLGVVEKQNVCRQVWQARRWTNSRRNEWFEWLMPTDWPVTDITHWMELPAAPTPTGEQE